MTEPLQPMSVVEVKASAMRVEEFPPFDDGTPFVARVRRVSLLAMLAAGRVPNHLLSIAWKALNNDQGLQALVSQEDPDQIKQFLELFLNGVLLEPTWEQVRQYLTDEQISALLAYATEGVRGLESFRGGQGSDASARGSGEDLGGQAEQLDPGPAE